MGTHHIGSRKADWVRRILRLSKLEQMIGKGIVSVSEPATSLHIMLDDRSIRKSKFTVIVCFLEQIAYPGIGFVVPEHWMAKLPAYPINNIHANQVDMTKFINDRDAGYVRVKDQLWLWYDGHRKDQNG